MAKLDKITFLDASLSRRDFLRHSIYMGALLAGGSTLAGLLAGCGTTAPTSPTSSGSSKSIEQIKIQLNWVKDVESAGMWAAMEKGYYKEEGLEVEVVPGGPQVDPTTVVAGGGYLLGRAANTTNHVKARLQGVPVKSFATTFQRIPSGLMSLAKNPVKSVKDAVGKRIGLQTGARGAWAVILRKAGLTEDQMQIVNVGVDPTPLATGQVDAYWCYVTNQPLALKAKGIDVYVLPAEEMGYVAYGDFFFTTEDILKNQKDLVIRWLRATIRGFEYNEKHPEEIARLTVEKYGAPGLKVEHQIEVNKAQIPLMKSPLTEKKGLCWMESSVWQQAVTDLLATGQIDKPISVDELMTLEILDKVYNGKNYIPI
ncbi:Twin-arginine translocation pathway, signal sequence [Moorella glycerini]|uniref:Thiamine pyrimidine synthase n=1 Tax=Neomoorella stamsii TaxID=1266720 RepID=A0A9X7P746_9FIRM|nr:MULTISPECIES: ABC transporter substrate-binding protein [Moorella]PRR76095.1 putative thiamine biosynthesis protein [Moorella stamsii]CEP68299.1 Twin-arginine translocation pathway, signal sequence [Moorella glycerini]